MPDDLSAARTFADVLDALDVDSRGLTFDADTQPKHLSFAELGTRTAELAARWFGLGVRHGDRVVLVVADEYEFIPLFLSALRAGIVAVPIYPPYRVGQLESYQGNLRRVCAASGAKCCVVSGPLRDLVTRAGLDLAVHAYGDLVAASPRPARRPDPDDLAFLQFSSGSTGPPRAAAISHRALLANVWAIRERLQTDGEADRAVSWLPLYHDMGLVGFLLVPMVDQVPTWYLPPLRFGRDPMSWLRLMSDVGGSIAFAPNFAYGLLTRRATDADIAGLNLSRWRVAGCGAEPVHADTLTAFTARFAAAGFRGAAFMPSYGLAESTLAVALSPRGTGLATLRVDADVLATHGRTQAPGPDSRRVTDLVSCGPPVAGTEVRVVDLEGRDCAEGMEGELVVRGSSLANGYYADPGTTAQTWQDGWLRTGDYGLLHSGQVYVTGRIKDLIVINGIKYHPQDIERVATEVAGVRLGNVAALAVQDGDTEAVRLAVAVRDGVDPQMLAEQVRRLVSRRLGLVLRDVIVVDGELPKTSSGKLRRSHTTELLETGELVALR